MTPMDPKQNSSTAHTFQAAKRALSYPFDLEKILTSKKKLCRILKASDQSLIPKKIAILGGSTTHQIRDLIELFLLAGGVEPTFFESDYNQFYRDLRFGNAELSKFEPDIIYVHTTHHNLMVRPEPEDTESIYQEKLQQQWQILEQMWQTSHFTCPLIQNNFELPPLRPLGNLSASHPGSMIRMIRDLNQRMAGFQTGSNRFYINDINYLSSMVGLMSWHDAGLWLRAKYALSFDAMVYLGHSVAKMVLAIFGLSKKCLVVDLDHTLWGGIIGDDGADGLELGPETPIGEAHTNLQGYIKQLNQRGVALAVNSKNDLTNALEGLSHPSGILRSEHFAAIYANWQPKPENIDAISGEINLGVDSMVFLDDNSVEQEAVRSGVPDVEVVKVGGDVAQYAEMLDRNLYFEPACLSREDFDRQSYYASNQQRSREKSAVIDYDGFLQSLVMQAEILPWKAVYLERITQLINKTNQFNLTTERCDHTEVMRIADDPSTIALYGRLQDRFGDNGLVSVIVGEVDGDVCRIRLWLMSCRVLKRGFEFAMLDQLVEEARAMGVQTLEGSYIPTAKNSMVRSLYEDCQFQCISDADGRSIWSLRLREYKRKNRLIEVNQ